MFMNVKHTHGKPCRKCGKTLRYKISRNCVACAALYYQPKIGRHVDRPSRYKDNDYIMFNNARHRALRKGMEFSITLDDIVIPEFCPVLKTPMESPSIDRIDNSKGYTKKNICVISNRANRLKQDSTIEELEAILAYMKSKLDL